MSDVIQTLKLIKQGDPSATEQLPPLVYDKLRKLAAVKMAQESPDYTLQATALVHEAFCASSMLKRPSIGIRAGISSPLPPKRLEES